MHQQVVQHTHILTHIQIYTNTFTLTYKQVQSTAYLRIALSCLLLLRFALHNEINALAPQRQHFLVLAVWRTRCQQRLLALIVTRKVFDVVKQPLYHLNVAIAKAGNEWCGVARVNNLNETQ